MREIFSMNLQAPGLETAAHAIIDLGADDGADAAARREIGQHIRQGSSCAVCE